MLAHLSGPIEVFSEKSCSGLCTKEYLKLFEEAPWDYYLVRQRQLELIDNSFLEKQISQLTFQQRADFYLGVLTLDDLLFTTFSLDVREKIKGALLKIRPSRKRFVSNAIVNIVNSQNFNIQRVKNKSFDQLLAGVKNENQQDYRKLPREFKELPNQYFNDDLIKLIYSGVKKILQRNNEIRQVNVIVHHTSIICQEGYDATNSPEGVHQDGMDYIVSAYVLERKNVEGGESVIYGGDKVTELFRTTLEPGFGIFQPDLDTDLWHIVEPISVTQGKKYGVRSTIGLDFEIIEKTI
ncbi:TPA: 2OG-Fe dioxygenase family protein [Photobacterium damselae]